MTDARNQNPQDSAPQDSKQNLRTGFTTGACATATSKAALLAWLRQETLAEIDIILPKGQKVIFAIDDAKLTQNTASASTIKDAGDDPDVTHGAKITSIVHITPHHANESKANQIEFKAGQGVGTVTKPGLPLPVGAPAINPVPRKMMIDHLEALLAEYAVQADITVEIAVENGEALAEKTWNPRLGIMGGLSILGTTGIVRPYSCSAWIHSIHRGIDVARALGLPHIAGSTGNLSEQAVQQHYQLSPHALIDMGDFAAGMLKYLRKNPIGKLTICGGFGKMLKLAAGHGDLHSGRSQNDFQQIALWGQELSLPDEIIAQISEANSAQHLLEILGDTQHRQIFLAMVADKAQAVAQDFTDKNITIDIMLIDRQGNIIYPL